MLEPKTKRADALDALRGLAILAMLLSGQLPFHSNTLPDWMYHAQVPPPDHVFIPTLPGTTWVDLVFPFFLFAMGAAFPLALSRRIDRGIPVWKISLSILERGFLLGFFALYVQAIRPYTIATLPTTAVWIEALLGFFLLFPILARLPEHWPPWLRRGVKTIGWAGGMFFLAFLRYPDGSGFMLTRSDIIIVVLTNMAVFGSFAWLRTRSNILLRLGILGILTAIRLSNMPQPVEGWVHQLWVWTPIPWMYTLYYTQYLFIVIPGTVAGDIILQWLKSPARDEERRWSTTRCIGIAILMAAFVLVLLVGLKIRMVVGTTILTFALCALGWTLLRNPFRAIEHLYKELFFWAVFWLVLGLFFEPYEGGIRKDRATMSYYFVTSGLAVCSFIFFSIIIDVFQKKRWLHLLIDNGQNPMIAYAGINNFITPVFALLPVDSLLNAMAVTPWLGFLKGLIVTLSLAVCVQYCTRMKLFWRT